MVPNGPIEVGDAKGTKSGGQSDQGRGRGIRSHICTLDSCRCMQLNGVSRLRGVALLQMLERRMDLFWKGEGEETADGVQDLSR